MVFPREGKGTILEGKEGKAGKELKKGKGRSLRKGKRGKDALGREGKRERQNVGNVPFWKPAVGYKSQVQYRRVCRANLHNFTILSLNTECGNIAKLRGV